MKSVLITFVAHLNMLMVRYSDHNLSVVLCTSTVVNNLFVNILEAIFFIKFSPNLVKMLTFMKAQMNLKLLHWIKNQVTRSNHRKPCKFSRDYNYIFGPIFTKLGQDVCLHDVSETDSYEFKKQITVSNWRKTTL